MDLFGKNLFMITLLEIAKITKIISGIFTKTLLSGVMMNYILSYRKIPEDFYLSGILFFIRKSVISTEPLYLGNYLLHIFKRNVIGDRMVG